MERKQVLLSDETIKDVTGIANKMYSGNFSMALRKIIEAGVLFPYYCEHEFIYDNILGTYNCQKCNFQMKG